MNVLKEAHRVAHGHLADLGDVLSVYGDGQRFLLQPAPAALRTGRVGHVAFVHFLHRVAAGFAVAALKVGDDALKRRLEPPHAAVALVFHGDFLVFRAVQQNIDDFLRQLAHRRVQREAVFLRKRVQIHARHAVSVLGAVPAGHAQRALVERLGGVGQDVGGVDLHQNAQTRAHRARAVGIVERKHARRHFLDGHAAVRTGVGLGIQRVRAVHLADDRQPLAQLHRGFQRIGQARVNVLANDEAVDHDFDGVLLVFVERRQVGKLVNRAVDARAHVAPARHVLQKLRVFALAAAHHGRENQNFRALRQRHHLIHNLVDRLLLNHAPALRAMRRARARVEQAQVVVNLRHRAHGGARVLAGGLLVDGNGGRQTLDGVDVRFVHLA